MKLISFLVIVLAVLYSDPTNPIETEVGSEFTIALDSNPVGGYEWQFAKPIDQSLLNLVHSEYKPSEVGGIDKSGKQIFTFKAIGKGSTMISLMYARSGERDMYPLDNKTFIVIIH